MFETIPDLTYVSAQILMFVAILLIVYSTRNILVLRRETVRRLKQKIETGTHTMQAGLGLALDTRRFGFVEKHILPENPKALQDLKKKLRRAGYRKPSAIATFYFWRIGLGIAAIVFSLLLVPKMMQSASLPMIAFTVAAIVCLAYMAPKFWIERAYQYRKMAIEKGFPEVLDLLLVCIEAGNGFDQALNRVVREIGESQKILAEELLIVTRELRAGKKRYQVLSDFAERSGVDDIISFITVIKQADRYGVSIAEALRVYSREMRDKRYMKAEEKANMMPVKLALGAIVFTVPPAILVMVGPSIIMIVRNLGAINT